MNIVFSNLNDQLNLDIHKLKDFLINFRAKLFISIRELSYNNLSNDDQIVFRFARANKLIDYCENYGEYVITPKGFNWDCDLMDVRFPGPEEDLLDRDK